MFYKRFDIQESYCNTFMIRWTTAIRRCDDLRIFPLDEKILVEKYNKYFLDMLSELISTI